MCVCDGFCGLSLWWLLCCVCLWDEVGVDCYVLYGEIGFWRGCDLLF